MEPERPREEEEEEKATSGVWGASLRQGPPWPHNSPALTHQSQSGRGRPKRAPDAIFIACTDLARVREDQGYSRWREEGDLARAPPQPNAAGMTQLFSSLGAGLVAESTNPPPGSRRLGSKSEAHPLDLLQTKSLRSIRDLCGGGGGSGGGLRTLPSKPKPG